MRTSEVRPRSSWHVRCHVQEIRWNVYMKIPVKTQEDYIRTTRWVDWRCGVIRQIIM